MSLHWLKGCPLGLVGNLVVQHTAVWFPDWRQPVCERGRKCLYAGPQRNACCSSHFMFALLLLSSDSSVQALSTRTLTDMAARHKQTNRQQ